LFFFIFVALLISYIDALESLIPDKIILPAIVILLGLKFSFDVLSVYDFVAAVIVLVIFVIPIFFNMNFGGGDLRFGAFCALFLGLPLIGWFILLSGVFHLLVLLILKKESFGFAPAMSAAAIASYIVGNI
jgi:Flp pilus assembly protein protease CpaA